MEPAAYKKVKKYLIAMDEKNLLGRGRLGEVRRGYQEEEKKVLVFKISGLPLSPKTQQLFRIQSQINQPNYLQTILPLAHSSTKCYTPYQHLPFSLYDFKQTYLSNPSQCKNLLQQLLCCYSYLHFLQLGHNNLKISNILFDSDYRLRLADMIPSGDFQTTSQTDMMEMGILLFEVYFGRGYSTVEGGGDRVLRNNGGGSNSNSNRFLETVFMMIEGKVTWEELFTQFGITNKYTRLRSQGLEYHGHNRVVLLAQVVNRVKAGSQEQAYLKMSLWRVIQRILERELQKKQEKSKYREILEKQYAQINKLCERLEKKRYVGLRDLLWNPKHFNVSFQDALCVLMSLRQDIDHCYLLKLLPQLNQGQVSVLFANYLQQTPFDWAM